MEYLIYQDNPRTDIWMRLVLGIPLVALAVGGSIALSEDTSAGLILLSESFFLLIVFICIIPTAYRIYNNKIQVAFRVPWSLNILFSNIQTLKIPGWFPAGINLPTCFSSSRALEIVRIKGMSVIISPSDRDAFMQNFRKAYDEWQRARDHVHESH